MTENVINVPAFIVEVGYELMGFYTKYNGNGLTG